MTIRIEERVDGSVVTCCAVLIVVAASACEPPPLLPDPEPTDCAVEWDKTCPPLEAWEAVPCHDAPLLQERGQDEARFHFDLVASGDCGVECGTMSLEIPRRSIQPFVRKALRRREDCRRCEIDMLEEFSARDVEVDVVATGPREPPSWSYTVAMVHPRRPFYPNADLTLEAVVMQVVREPGQPRQTAALLRRCPDGSVSEACERLVFGPGAREAYGDETVLTAQAARLAEEAAGAEQQGQEVEP